MYHQKFVPPPPLAHPTDRGRFICHIPSILQPLLTPDVLATIAYTGDDKGNSYKLTYADVVETENKQKHQTTDQFWFHLIPTDAASKLQRRVLYEKTQEHLSKYGMEIEDYDDAFKPKMLANSEQRDGNKWHVEYKLHMNQVPFSGGSVNARGLNRLELGEDPDTGKPLTAKLWFRPDLLEKIFGACKVCFVPVSACFGHDDPRKGNKDGKRTTAAAANAAAQERIAKKAAAGSSGRFTF